MKLWIRTISITALTAILTVPASTQSPSFLVSASEYNTASTESVLSGSTAISRETNGETPDETPGGTPGQTSDETTGQTPDENTDPEPETTKKEQQITAEDITASLGDEPFAIKIWLPDNRGGLSYTSGDPDIAEIDKEGMITVHRIGTTTITITAGETDLYKESTKQITLTVKMGLTKPQAPVITNTESGVQVTWTKESKAEGYYLYRKSSGGEWELLAKLSGADSTSYHDQNIATGITYAYRIQTYAVSESETSSNGASRNCRYMTAPIILNVEETAGGNRLLWSKSTGSSGYHIYRRADTETDWTLIAELSSSNNRCWTDQNVSSNIYYHYRIAAYYRTTSTSSESVPSQEAVFLRLKPPTTVKQTSQSSGRKLKVSWTKNTSADGYQVQYATDGLFTSLKTKTVTNASTGSLTISGLNRKKSYYARVRSYKTVNGRKYYSAWNVTSKVKKNRSGTAKGIKNGKKLWELRAKSKQKLYQYDTAQGSCTDGTYAYIAMYNRKVENCKIVKIRLSNMKVVKTSTVLPIAHGNDITYIPEKNCLAVVHTTINAKRISMIHPDSLTVMESRDISIPSGLSGATTAERKAISGFCGITYNPNRRQYVLLLSKTYNFLILNENMEAIAYVKPTRKYAYTYQGIDSTGDYILVSQSPKRAGSRNSISVYTWDGTFISQIATRAGYEMEGIFHAGKQFYAVSYRSYYKIYYTKKKKTVTVKVKGRKKKKKVTVKIRHKKLMRDNYIYKLSNF